MRLFDSGGNQIESYSLFSDVVIYACIVLYVYIVMIIIIIIIYACYMLTRLPSVNNNSNNIIPSSVGYRVCTYIACARARYVCSALHSILYVYGVGVYTTL